jgi:His-Xaa-Ser system radical SAM maturase HxsC
MIPLVLAAKAEGSERFVTRLSLSDDCKDRHHNSICIKSHKNSNLYSGENGLFQLDGCLANEMDGDVIVVDPKKRVAERLIRADSLHNTFLITERCDQLCVMCSQPPKKFHVDRFDEFAEAAMLAPLDMTIGLSGGEPTLFMDRLLWMIETVRHVRPDISFHILSNGQHFEEGHVDRLSQPAFDKVTWGIPLYSRDAALHDGIVQKEGAYDRLMHSFVYLLKAGAKIELRTVLLAENAESLPELANFVASHLGFCVQWSIMQLENIGFAKNRFHSLYVNHADHFQTIANAVDISELHGLAVALFNFPRCSVPSEYRKYAVASISDWKRKYVPSCNICSEQSSCCGFFEWHPDSLTKVSPL